MRRLILLLTVSCLGAAIMVGQTMRAGAAPAVIWETTFGNCSEWNQTQGLNDNQVCGNGDGISGYGNWTTSNGTVDQITAAANNPAGPGGRGFRHWRGAGVNNNGGGLRIVLPAQQSEIWVRWYMRYQSGFAWSSAGQPNYTKDLYFNVTNSNYPVFTVGFHDTSLFGVAQVQPTGRNLYGGPPGWLAANGGSAGDGAWHAYETHVKMGTSNGIAESWVDGVRTHNQTNVNWGSSGGWEYFVVGSNQSLVASGVDRYTDYDDFAISTSGYIGPLGVPVAPQNLRITSE